MHELFIFYSTLHVFIYLFMRVCTVKFIRIWIFRFLYHLYCAERKKTSARNEMKKGKIKKWKNGKKGYPPK